MAHPVLERRRREEKGNVVSSFMSTGRAATTRIPGLLLASVGASIVLYPSLGNGMSYAASATARLAGTMTVLGGLSLLHRRRRPLTPSATTRHHPISNLAGAALRAATAHPLVTTVLALLVATAGVFITGETCEPGFFPRSWQTAIGYIGAFGAHAGTAVVAILVTRGLWECPPSADETSDARESRSRRTTIRVRFLVTVFLPALLLAAWCYAVLVFTAAR